MNFIAKARESQIWSEPRTMVGIGLIVLSYVACWPVISVLGVIAARNGNTGLIFIGGPVVYLMSHLLLFAGLFLAGKSCAGVMLRALIHARRTVPGSLR